MDIKEIIREVALRIGAETGDSENAVETAYPMIGERIKGEAEHCAAEAILATPRSRLTGWRLLPEEGLERADDGSVVLPLPEDFLLLHSVRMSDWEREVTELLPSDHWLTKLQGSRWHGLRGSPTRPLAFRGLGRTGEPVMRLYTSGAGSRLAEGWYLPAPRINAAGEIEIPAAAYHTTIENIVTSLRSC